jgi:hypothetical protein
MVQTFPDFDALVLDNASSRPFGRPSTIYSFGRWKVCIQASGPESGWQQSHGSDRPRRLARAARSRCGTGPGLARAAHGATRGYPAAVMFGSTQLDAADPHRLDGAGDHYLAIGLAWRGGYGWPLAALPPEREVFAPCGSVPTYFAMRTGSMNGSSATWTISIWHFAPTPASPLHPDQLRRGQARRGRIERRQRFWPCRPLLPLRVLALAFLKVRAIATGMALPVGTGIVEGGGCGPAIDMVLATDPAARSTRRMAADRSRIDVESPNLYSTSPMKLAISPRNYPMR